LGQIEVFEWLKKQRQTGNDQFFSVKEIEKGVTDCGLFNGNGRGVRGAIIMLEAYDYLEVDYRGRYTDFGRVFRIKKKYTRSFDET
jgi:hypothetical protein